MNEKLPMGRSIERKPRLYAAMERVVASLFAKQGLDGSRTQSFIADVLAHHGVEAAPVFHRLKDETQYAHLLLVLEDPEDEEEIAALFSPEHLPEDLKKHYGLS